MKLQELIIILKRLYKDYIRKHLKRLFYSFLLSLVVAGSTASIAYLLDPAVKKIFIDNDRTLAWLIPLGIIFVFTAKGLSLYFARTLVIQVGALVAGEMQKEIANNILVLSFGVDLSPIARIKKQVVCARAKTAQIKLARFTFEKM